MQPSVPARPGHARRGPLGGIAGLVRDPVLAVIMVGTAAVMAAILAVPTTGARVVLFWLPQPLLDIVFCVLCRRVVTGLAGQPAPARRFWRTMVLTGMIFTVGDLVQTVGTVHRPVAESAAGGVAQTVCTVVGIGCLVWVMLTLPTGIAGSARIRMWLDAATVMVAAVVFAWYFSASSGPGRPVDVASALAGSAIMLVAVFAVVKLMLGGTAPFTPQAGAAGAAVGGMLGVAVALTPPLVDAGHLGVLLALRLAPSALLVLTPRIQELQLRADPTALAARRTRPYSRLPYVAVLATQGLVVAILAGLHPAVRVWGVVAGMQVIIGVVVVRQLLAFTDNAQLLHRLRHLASHDPLTQLPNRLLFDERIRAALAGPPDQPAGASLLLIDLDGFKAVNDTYGHPVGDGLLVAVAGRLRACARAGDTVTRLGGDEFGMLLPDTPPEVAAEVVGRIRAAFDDPVAVAGHQLRIRASIGVAGAHDRDAEALLRAADAAMYSAKRRRQRHRATAAPGGPATPGVPGTSAFPTPAVPAR